MSSVSMLRNIAIEFSSKEMEQLGRAMNRYLCNPNNKTKMAIVDMFTPQIERKASAAAAHSNGKISAIDYVQDLYLKLLESLEALKKQQEPQVSSVIKALDKRKPIADSLVSCGEKYIDDILPEEGAKVLSVYVGEKTLLQKAHDVVDYTGKSLVQKQKEALEMFLEGKTFAEIGEKFDVTEKRAEAIFNAAIKSLQNISKKNNLGHLYYDDVPLTYKKISADKPLFDISRKRVQSHAKSVLPKKVGSYTAEDVRKMIQEDLPQINVEDIIKQL